MFHGRETKIHILPTKINEQIAKVSRSYNNYPFRIKTIQQQRQQQQEQLFDPREPLFARILHVRVAGGQLSAACDSAARRRRERRLRSWLRRDRMTVATALAGKLHNSAQRPMMARAVEEGHEDKYNAPRRQKTPLPAV